MGAEASPPEEPREESLGSLAQCLLVLAALGILVREEDGGEGDAELQADLTDDAHQQLVHVVVQRRRGLHILAVERRGHQASLCNSTNESQGRTVGHMISF